MTFLAWNLALAFVWAAVLGELSLANVAVGYGLGFLILAFTAEALGLGRYVSKAWKTAEFIAFFLAELFLSGARVALDVLTPRDRARPGIVAVPLRARTDAEITLLSNLVSLTPGSLALDVSADRRTLFVHVMFLDDVEAEVVSIQEGFERRVLELLR